MRDCSAVPAPPPGATPPPGVTTNTNINNSINRLQEAAQALRPFDWLLIALVVLIIIWLSRKGSKGGKA